MVMDSYVPSFTVVARVTTLVRKAVGIKTEEASYENMYYFRFRMKWIAISLINNLAILLELFILIFWYLVVVPCNSIFK